MAYTIFDFIPPDVPILSLLQNHVKTEETHKSEKRKGRASERHDEERGDAQGAKGSSGKRRAR